ncbi:formin-like protein 5 [Herpailurus yagouaroundi]|uniref:formin-like protein 5 n=1 Tax=Herpailurus yagouaroundi TaxID=1608482 RepID=UPI001AD727AC|nr:formin-like protein 5 [Puma yagouaroundi]
MRAGPAQSISSPRPVYQFKRLRAQFPLPHKKGSARFKLASPTFETVESEAQPVRYLGAEGGLFLNPAPHTILQQTFSFLRPSRQSSSPPKIPVPLPLVIPEFWAKVASGAPPPPQIPPVPCNHSVRVSPTPTLSCRVQPSTGVQGPPNWGSANPSPGFCPYSLQEKQSNSASPAPTHRLIFPRAAALHRPRRPLAWPRPPPPPSLRPRPPRPGPAAAPAAAVRPLRASGAQSARPSSAPAATASSPPPALRRATGGDQLGAGEAAPPRGAARTPGAGAAPSFPPATDPPSSPGAAARRGPGGQGGEARSVSHATPCAPPRAAVVGSARRAPGPRPLRSHHGGHPGTRGVAATNENNAGGEWPPSSASDEGTEMDPGQSAVHLGTR